MNKLLAVTQLALCFLFVFCNSGGGTKPSELAGQWEYGSGVRNVKDLGRVPEQIELFKDGTGVVEGNSISWKVENKRLVFLSSQSGFACNYKLSGYALIFIDDNGDSATFVRKGKLEEFKVKQAADAEKAAEKERNERIASFEKAGDEAYDMVKRSTGDARLIQLKNAYVNYDKAVKSNPNNISNKLRERYLDMCIARVQWILDEGNASMSAIPLLQNNIDTYLTANIPADIRQRYATFLAQLGDSSVSKANYIEAISYYNKAIEKAANPAPFKAKLATTVEAEKTKQMAANTERLAKVEETKRAVEQLSKQFVFISGGTFTMGCTPEQADECFDPEKPAHSVTVGDFSIGKYEVTRELWNAVMGRNSSDVEGDKNLPVGGVTWDDVQTFIQKLNSMAGEKYRLPTEVEWEYAARGGNKSKGFKYSGSNTIDDVAWYSSKVMPVGTKAPNELGIYDMSGNVCEWVNDRYKDYSSFTKTAPTGSAADSHRVIRGGDNHNGARYCRVSYRYFNYSGYDVAGSNFHLGFRLAVSP